MGLLTPVTSVAGLCSGGKTLLPRQGSDVFVSTRVTGSVSGPDLKSPVGPEPGLEVGEDHILSPLGDRGQGSSR